LLRFVIFQLKLRHKS